MSSGRRRVARVLLDQLPDVEPVAVGIGENEAAQAEVGVAQRLDDSNAVCRALFVQRGGIIDHQVRDVLGRCLVALVQAQVQLCRVLFEYHKPDGVAIFKDFLESEHAAPEVQCAPDIPSLNRGRKSSELDAAGLFCWSCHDFAPMHELEATDEAVLGQLPGLG